MDLIVEVVTPEGSARSGVPVLAYKKQRAFLPGGGPGGVSAHSKLYDRFAAETAIPKGRDPVLYRMEVLPAWLDAHQAEWQ